jgi:hypothetical protein
MKKTLTTIVAAVGVLSTVFVPVMASAATTASSYSVNILPAGSTVNTWGTSTLTADDIDAQFYWKVSPADSKNYTYSLSIDYYTPGALGSYVGSVAVMNPSGVGVLDGYVAYPQVYLGPGTYVAKLTGTWSATDGTHGSIGTASTSFNYAM